MKTIGFKNFRRFENLEPLQLSGVNFFVGGNNSGKSTVTKAMILLLDNLANSYARLDTGKNSIQGILNHETPFRFDANHIHDVHIGTFGRALHRPYPQVEEIVFESQLGEFNVLYVICGDKESYSSVASIKRIEVTNVQNNVHYVFDFEANKFLVHYNSSVLKKYAYGVDTITDYDSIRNFVVHHQDDAKEGSQCSIVESLTWQKSTFEKLLAQEKNPVRIATMNNEISKINSKLSILTKANFDNPFESDYSYEDNKEVVFESELKYDFGKQNPTAIFSLLGAQWENYTNIDSNVPKYRRDFSELSSHEIAFVLMLACDSRSISDVFSNHTIEYIPAHAVTQKLLCSIDDKNDYMGHVIREFEGMKFTKGDNAYGFIEYWMKELEIGLGVNIEPYMGESYSVQIYLMDGSTMPLADLGMGSIQLVLLLMRLATIMYRNHRWNDLLIIVEEPEQNIHPKWQSKLADLFKEVNEKFGFRFIIETHSEYMIRRTQAMIATGDVEFEKNPFKVYYFPEKGQPYDMEYQKSGRFVQSFGHGFFDESAKHTMEISKKELQEEASITFNWDN